MPQGSGIVSCVQALPNGRHLLVASNDNIRLYDLLYDQIEVKSEDKTMTVDQDDVTMDVKVPFTIISGHHGGQTSSMSIFDLIRNQWQFPGKRKWDLGLGRNFQQSLYSLQNQPHRIIK